MGSIVDVPKALFTGLTQTVWLTLIAAGSADLANSSLNFTQDNFGSLFLNG